MIKSKKALYYELMKLKNYKESVRLEAIDIDIDNTPMDRKSLAKAKMNLISKYSNL